MDTAATNPFALLSFISAPAVLTNASCVLLFGTGNRYARAVDRMHELAKAVDAQSGTAAAEDRFRITQLKAAEHRSLLIVRAMTFFYASVAAFVFSTLVSLLGATLFAFGGGDVAIRAGFGVCLVGGAAGVAGMIGGALLLVRETRESFTVLAEENRLISDKLKAREAKAL
jgi:hypothetical protein